MSTRAIRLYYQYMNAFWHCVKVLWEVAIYFNAKGFRIFKRDFRWRSDYDAFIYNMVEAAEFQSLLIAILIEIRHVIFVDAHTSEGAKILDAAYIDVSFSSPQNFTMKNGIYCHQRWASSPAAAIYWTHLYHGQGQDTLILLIFLKHNTSMVSLSGSMLP